MWTPLRRTQVQSLLETELQRPLTEAENEALERYASGDREIGGSPNTLSAFDLDRITGSGELELALRALPSRTDNGLERPVPAQTSIRGFAQARAIAEDRVNQSTTLRERLAQLDGVDAAVDVVAAQHARHVQALEEIERDQVRWSLAKLNGGQAQLSFRSDPAFAGALASLGAEGIDRFVLDSLMTIDRFDPGPARLGSQRALVAGYQAALGLGESEEFLSELTLDRPGPAVERYEPMLELTEVANPALRERLVALGTAPALQDAIAEELTLAALSELSGESPRALDPRALFSFYEAHGLQPESTPERLAHAAAHALSMANAFDGEIRESHWLAARALMDATQPTNAIEKGRLQALEEVLDAAQGTLSGWRREGMLYIAALERFDGAALDDPAISATVESAVADFEEVLRSLSPEQAQVLLQPGSGLAYRFELLGLHGTSYRYSGALAPQMSEPGNWPATESPLAAYEGAWGTEALDVFVAEARYRLLEGVRRTSVTDQASRETIDAESAEREALRLDEAWRAFEALAPEIRELEVESEELAAVRARFADELEAWARAPETRPGTSRELFERLSDAQLHLYGGFRPVFNELSAQMNASARSHPPTRVFGMQAGVSWPNWVSLGDSIPLVDLDAVPAGAVVHGDYTDAFPESQYRRSLHRQP